jgi:hypothetical protein
MKKKGLLIALSIIGVLAIVVLVMVFTGGGVTEADEKQGIETDKVSGKILENPEEIEMPKTNPKADSLEQVLDLEEFDPNDI